MKTLRLFAALLLIAWRADVALDARRATSLTITPNTSVAELLRGADAVVLVTAQTRVGTRVGDTRPELERADTGLVLPEALPVVFTEYDVTAMEVFKQSDTSRLDWVTRIASRGGTGQYNGRTVNERTHAPDLGPGRQHLIFLQFSKSIDAMLFDVFGVFDVSGAAVDGNQRLRATRHGKELIGLPSDQALDHVRALLAEPRP